MKIFLLILISLITGACSESKYTKTAEKVEINRYMGKWYVMAHRFTFLEKDVHNALEVYTWNHEKERVDIDFNYNKGSLNGPIKSIPQKGWIINKQTNAYWEVSPLWPFRADYLILDIADDYSWVAVGVPSQNYLWIMARDPKFSREQISAVLKRLGASGYNIKDITYVSHG